MTKIQSREVLREPYFNVILNGKSLHGTEFLKYVEQVNFVEEENKIPTATLTIQDIDHVWTDSGNVKRSVPIKVIGGHRKNYREWIDGVIQVVEPDFGEDGSQILQLGIIEKSGEKLQKEREEKTYKNMKVSDVIREMLRECGAKAEVQDTGAVLESIPFNQRSYIDFITEWADDLKWILKKGAYDGKYHFGNFRDTRALGVLSYLTGGQEIRNFTAMYQDPTGELSYDGEEDKNLKRTLSQVSSLDGFTYEETIQRAKSRESDEITNSGYRGGSLPTRRAKGKEL